MQIIHLHEHNAAEPPVSPLPNRNTLSYGLFLALYCIAVDVFGNLRYQQSFSLLQVIIIHE